MLSEESFSIDYDHMCGLAREYADYTPEEVLLSSRPKLSKEERKGLAIQIKIRKSLKQKLPTWYDVGVYIPSTLNLEQASSEWTALYKQQFVRGDDILIDLTGGMGVDFWAMSQRAKMGVYIEQNKVLYDATAYNLGKLHPKTNIKLLNSHSEGILEELIREYNPTLIYLDPARRDDKEKGKRVYAIEDCTPSVIDIISRLKAIGTGVTLPRLLVKLSPMLDVKHTLRTVPETECVHVVALKGEVKELLLEIKLCSNQVDIDDIPLKAINLNPHGKKYIFEGIYQAEKGGGLNAESLGSYLYEPNSALMKLGLFNQIGHRWGIYKLHPNSHLYTSDIYVEDFPGRSLLIREIIPYKSSVIKTLCRRISGAQITCRNFPISAETLKKKLHLPESSTATLVATTLYDGSEVLLLCETSRVDTAT